MRKIEKRGRGRPPSGRSREEIERDSAKKYRDNLVQEGKVKIQAYVAPETREHLRQFKTNMELATIGDVIDILVLQEVKRRNLS